jgi:hypothetical protein
MTLGERLNVKADEIATHVLTQMQQNDKIAGKYTYVLTKVWYPDG